MFSDNKYLQRKYAKKVRTNARAQDRLYKSVRHELVTEDSVTNLGTVPDLELMPKLAVMPNKNLAHELVSNIWSQEDAERFDIEEYYREETDFIENCISFNEWWADF